MVSDSGGQGVGKRTCRSNRVPGDADVAGATLLRTTAS